MCVHRHVYSKLIGSCVFVCVRISELPRGSTCAMYVSVQWLGPWLWTM